MISHSALACTGLEDKHVLYKVYINRVLCVYEHLSKLCIHCVLLGNTNTIVMTTVDNNS